MAISFNTTKKNKLKKLYKHLEDFETVGILDRENMTNKEAIKTLIEEVAQRMKVVDGLKSDISKSLYEEASQAFTTFDTTNNYLQKSLYMYLVRTMFSINTKNPERYPDYVNALYDKLQDETTKNSITELVKTRFLDGITSKGAEYSSTAIVSVSSVKAIEALDKVEDLVSFLSVETNPDFVEVINKAVGLYETIDNCRSAIKSAVALLEDLMEYQVEKKSITKMIKYSMTDKNKIAEDYMQYTELVLIANSYTQS